MEKEENILAKNYIESLFSELSKERDFDFPIELAQIDNKDVSAIYEQSKKNHEYDSRL